MPLNARASGAAASEASAITSNSGWCRTASCPKTHAFPQGMPIRLSTCAVWAVPHRRVPITRSLSIADRLRPVRPAAGTRHGRARQRQLEDDVLPKVKVHLLGPERQQPLGLARDADAIDGDTELMGEREPQRGVAAVVDTDQPVFQVVEPVVGPDPVGPARTVDPLVPGVVGGPPLRHRLQVVQLALVAVTDLVPQDAGSKAEIHVFEAVEVRGVEPREGLEDLAPEQQTGPRHDLEPPRRIDGGVVRGEADVEATVAVQVGDRPDPLDLDGDRPCAPFLERSGQLVGALAED